MSARTSRVSSASAVWALAESKGLDDFFDWDCAVGAVAASAVARKRTQSRGVRIRRIRRNYRGVHGEGWGGMYWAQRQTFLR